MMKCKNCGAILEEGTVFCPECGTRVESETTLQDVAKEVGKSLTNAAVKAGTFAKETSQTAYENYQNNNAAIGTVKEDIASVNDGAGRIIFKLAEGEIPVKTYCCTILGKVFRRVPGYMTVTNKRILFYTGGGDETDSLIMETAISSVKSITVYFGLFIRWWMLILGILLAMYSLPRLGGYNGTANAFYLLIAAGLIFLSFSKSAIVNVVGEGNPTPAIHFGNSINMSSSIMSMRAVKGPDCVKMKQEIGAMVYDLQTLGDQAISKWKD